MNVNDVFDRAYENAMRQGYTIDRDALRGCIEAVTADSDAFTPAQRDEMLLYIKEKPEMLPTSAAKIPEWCQQWARFFETRTQWEATVQASTDAESPPPLLCDFGL